jgi:hypothetical protein
MANWLYLASDTYAAANATYELATNGFVWRTYYADRQPPQAIPHVADLAIGDTLYLGYRQPGQIHLLGRFRIGRPDIPLQQSPVFCTAPAALLNQLGLNNYGPDPILGQFVGIFVQEAEPINVTIPALSTNPLSIVPLAADPLGDPVSGPSEFPSIKAPTINLAVLTDLDHTYAGIDIGARLDKGYDLCFLGFVKGVLTSVTFEPCPYPRALPSTSQMRGIVAAGDFRHLACLTYNAAVEIAAELSRKLATRSPRGVFIDSPSGFSRNQRGHGRATEKVRYRNVRFQCTPSTAAKREHRGDWSWLVYGMVAYMAFLHRGQEFSKDAWSLALRNGLYCPTRKLHDRYLRECFPTATISVLREDQARCERVQRLLHPHQDIPEIAVVLAYLNRGVSAVKQRSPLYDRADALVAGLSSLPYALPQICQEVERLPRTGIRWLGNPGDDLLEGRIVVVE